MPVLNFMPHQQQALDQTESFNRCAYYLDMGLGKTFVGAEKMYLLNNDEEEHHYVDTEPDQYAF